MRSSGRHQRYLNKGFPGLKFFKAADERCSVVCLLLNRFNPPWPKFQVPYTADVHSDDDVNIYRDTVGKYNLKKTTQGVLPKSGR